MRLEEGLQGLWHAFVLVDDEVLTILSERRAQREQIAAPNGCVALSDEAIPLRCEMQAPLVETLSRQG